MSPYAHTKLILEGIFQNIYNSNNDFSAGILRYFNSVGGHESGLLKESSKTIPSNLFPVIMRALSGQQPYVEIFGNQHPTRDGTAVRDYIHVVDLAKAHVSALTCLLSNPHSKFTVNLGMGIGYTVLEVLKTFIQICGKDIPYKVGGQRKGDPAISYANVSLAKKLLGWQATKSLEEMCKDTLASYGMAHSSVDYTPQ
jgi:UDP-glucose 4-epimerase